MEKTVSFYENMTWDYTIRNDDNTINELRMNLFSLLHSNVENFEHYLIDDSPSSSQEADIAAPSISRKRTTVDLSSPLSPRDSKHNLRLIDSSTPLSPRSASTAVEFSAPYSAKRLATVAFKQ